MGLENEQWLNRGGDQWFKNRAGEGGVDCWVACNCRTLSHDKILYNKLTLNLCYDERRF